MVYLNSYILFLFDLIFFFLLFNFFSFLIDKEICDCSHMIYNII